MSREQRAALDAMLRQAPQPAGPLPVEQMRASFAAFMGSFQIPPGGRRTATRLGERPAILVEPAGDAAVQDGWLGGEAAWLV
jgi:hypothetical protein